MMGLPQDFSNQRRRYDPDLRAKVDVLRLNDDWYTVPRACAGRCGTRRRYMADSAAYGWHFYQAADDDIIVSSDDARFGHPSFRFVGWGPRIMYDCNFVNRVVPRVDLAAEVEKYATACSRTRPIDVVVM